MRLIDLDPVLTATSLRFRCPACGDHQIIIPVGPIANAVPPVWSLVGDVDHATVLPSIDSKTGPCHWHGFITNGLIVNA